MASLLPFERLLLFLLIFHSKASSSSSSSSSSSIPALLALNFTLQPTLQSINLTITILNHLAIQTAQAGFATISTGSEEPGRSFNGLMQCRVNLNPATCTLCVRIATQTIIDKCLNSDAATVWLDGCYAYYYNNIKFSHATHITMSSESHSSNVRDQEQFNSARDTLFLQLRASLSIPSHKGFSHSEISYDSNNTGSKVYGLADCVRLLSAEECEICAEKAINKLYECCGDKQGGVVVDEQCMVRFEIYKFYSTGDGPDRNVYRVYTDNESDSCKDVKVMRVVWIWCTGVVCCIGLVLGTWLLRRKVVNTAKVVMVADEMSKYDKNKAPSGISDGVRDSSKAVEVHLSKQSYLRRCRRPYWMFTGGLWVWNLWIMICSVPPHVKELGFQSRFNLIS